jgi:transposase
VFDAGQNSEGNYDLLDSLPFHFVGSLPPSDHPDLLAVGKAGYRPVDEQRFPGLVAYETEKVVFGQRRRVVLTHSDDLHAKQCAGFDQTLAKARRQLAGLQARLARARRKGPRTKSKPRWPRS